MADAILRIKTVMDMGDAVSNVSTLQKALSKLKLPDNLKDSLTKNISSFYKEYDKYQKKLSDGIKTQGDFNQIEKSLNRLKSLYTDIGKDAAKAIKIDPAALFDLDEGKFKGIVDKIENTLKQLSDVKIDTKAFTDPIEEIAKLTKNQKIVGEGGILNRMMGHLETGNVAEAKKEYESLMQIMQKAAPKFDEFGNKLNKPGTFSVAHYEQLKGALDKLGTALLTAGKDTKPLEEELNRLQTELAETINLSSKDLIGNVGDYNKQAQGVEKVTDSLKRMHEQEYNFNRQAQDIDRQIQSYFGLSQMIRKVADIARDAFQTVKELDAAMVETAVVTNFDVGDMWNMLPTYTANANELGSTIKDVYEAATLYFQQGLNLSQSMGLANETLKMARIGGLQAAEATNMMTAALRGFNMEINQVSAKRINDVYSELAAITAADTKEIGSAMERTASIANSANMEFETTSAFLAQMIETTREAPENLGTAMKTIIARFQEMKQDPTKLVDSEGVALDANKIDTALKTIGVDLKNQKGEFRDLDDVFLDISERWDSLTQGQQRYIATIAAGSRQQSRFIAMMQNYERVKELVDAANNSAGAGQKQFEKTLEGLSAKLNKLKNAWDQFTMGLMNSQVIKTGVDALTGFFTVVNKLFDLLTKPMPDPFGGLIKSAITLVSTLMMLNLGKKGARGAVMAGVGWWKGEGKITDNFKAGWGIGTKGQKEKNIPNANQIYQQQLDKRLTDLGKQQKKKVVNVPISINPQIQKDYLAKIEASGLSKEVKQKIREELKGPITAETQVNVNTIIADNTENIADRKDLLLTSDMLEGGEQVDRLGGKFGDLTGKITECGNILWQFGDRIGGPFGSAISTAGTLLMTLGSSLEAIVISTQKNIAAAMEDIAAKTAEAGSTEALSIAQSKAVITSRALGAALWTSLGPLLAIAAIVGAAVVAYKLLDAAIVTNKEELEATTDAAAAASEAFDLAKQETSELSDAISRIQETDKAFDNLVVGTAEFNEQLVTANQQITELLQKYPMLNDPKYLSTDKNGLMHINEAGLKAVKEYQKQIQARASATNIIQAADLAALENRQKAEKLEKKSWGLDQDEIDKNKENAKLLRDRAKAETELARINAIRTSLQGQEIGDVEAIASVYADLYEEKRKAAEVDVESMGKHDIRQAYADYHGYKYNKSTGKIKDAEGNEVDYDDKVLKDEVIENTVLLDFEANAASLDVVLNDLDRKFRDTLGGAFEGSEHVISDILSGNIETNTDILEQILGENSTELQDLVNNLSEEEVATILGISVEEVKNTDFDKVTDLLTEKAINLADAQSESYSKLASMMAQSEFGTIQKAEKANQDEIRKTIKDLTTQQAATLSNIGQTLDQNVGSEAMATFVDKAADIYLSSSEDVVKEFDSILEEINWESAASRLEGYNKAIKSSNETIKDWGESMRKSADEANLIGEAFDEFVSGDWEKLSENADNFKNAMGQIDGAGIMKAAEQSKSLKALLDSGEVSATAVAQALQGIEDGKYSVGAVDTAVLQLISSLNRLEDAATEAHNIIQNFDAGIDYGEGEDFMIENAKKAQEYMNNQEWGNQQLQNYIKLAAGVDVWNEALLRHHGDMEATTKELSGTVTQFANGLNDAYDKLEAGKGLNGKSISQNLEESIKAGRIDEELKSKLEQVKVWWDSNGDLQFTFPEDFTTRDLEAYFKEAGGMSAEYAKLFMQDVANYTDTEMSRLQAGDLKQTLTSAEFQKQVARNGQGQGIITDAQFNILKDIGGDTALEEVAVALGYVADESKSASDKLQNNLFQTLKDGKEITDGLDLARRYAETYQTGKKSARSLASVEEFQDTQGRLDISKLTTGFEKVMSSTQAFQASWETYRKLDAQNKTMSYNGQELKKNIATEEEFRAAISELADKSQWYDVGQSIAEGIISYMNSNKNQDAKEDTKLSDDEKTGFHLVDWLKQRQKEKETGTEEKSTSTTPSDYSPSKFLGGIGATLNFDAQTAQINAKIKQINDAFGGLVDGIKPESINSPEAQAALNSVWKTAMKGQAQDLTTELKSSLDTLGISVEDAFNAGLIKDTKIKDSSQKAGEKLAKDAATGIEDGTKKYTGGGAHGGAGQKTPGRAQEVQTKGKVTDSIANVQEAVVKVTTQEVGLKETKDKVDKLKDAASKQQTIKVGAQVNKTANTALDSIKKIREAVKKKNTVNVDAKVKGKDDTNNLGSVIKNVKPKTVSVKANVSGANKVSTLKNQLNNLPTRKDIYITTHKNTVGGDRKEKGQNNYIPHRSVPSLGSLAKGSRYGRLGPKGKGGLTLTGEKGFEIAWIPSESRSMILGVEGPQMLNLPSDAVIYTHEQSKEILKKKQTIDAGSHSGRHKSSGSSGKSKKKSKKKKNKKNKDKSKGTINNFSMEEVVRFNIDPKLTALTDAIEKRTKDIEKSLTKIGNTYDNIVKSAKDQITALKGVQDYNQKLYNSYNNQLAELRKQKGSVSWTDDKGKSHDKTINISSYLNADGSVNQAAIAKLSTRAEREATFNFISGLAKPLTDGMESAKKAIQDAQNQIDELGQKISEAFYQWENELTEVYDLTQRINDEVSLTDRFTSQVELELAKLNAGFGNTAESIGNIRKVLIRSNDVIQKQIENQQQIIAARQRELQAAYSTQDELDKLNKYKNDTTMDSATKTATVKWAQELLKGAELGKKYVKNIFKDIDGHIEYEIDWAGFNADNDQSPYNKSTYDAIKKYLDDLNNAATEFNKSIQDQTDFIKQTYDALKEYQDKIVDVEDTLIKGVEEEIENETANAKKISDSIRDSLKNLLDEVKRKLDERRQQEDNAKTERDIAQKQQRLAALRADTAGGHQVEIAQLEKEIAEAQQDYGRTLEDQLLNRLEQQADEAAKQRERQIELAETANDLNASTNKELVDMWLKDPEKYKEEIKNAWLEANDYAEKGEAGQYVLQQEFESLFTELVTAVEQSGFNSAEGIFTATAENTNTLVNLLTELNNDLIGRQDELAHALNAQTDATDRNTESLLVAHEENYSAKELRDKGVDANTLKQLGYTNNQLVEGGYTAKELKEAGLTAAEVAAAGISDAGALKAGGYSAADIKSTGASASDLKNAGFTASDLKDLFSALNLKDIGFTAQNLKDAGLGAAALKGAGFTGAALKGAGYSASQLKAAGFDQYGLGAAGYSYADAKAAGYTAAQLQGVSQYASQAKSEIDKTNKYNAYMDYLKSVKKLAAKKVTKGHVNQLFKLGAAAGYGKASVLLHLVGSTGGSDPFSWKNIFKAIIDADGIDRYNLVKTWPNGNGTLADAIKTLGNPDTYSEIKKKTKYKNAKALAFKTGGIADFTGPAWLDGTPSKPELVLNAKDTKNFIALRDVLSNAMKSTGSTSNSYGDIMYEININVDHLNSDYDVEKVVDKVKREIVKGAGYRNVTQVRNFR